MRAAARRAGPWVTRWAGAPGAPLAVCVLGLALGLNATAVTGLFVLAVIVASVVAGPRAGVVASLLSFVGLNYFFTPPVRTFTVGKAEDLVALAVFLVVSLVVGRLFSTLVAERRRAELREREMGQLLNFAQTLLGGSSLPHTLDLIARSLVEAFALEGAEIRLERRGDEPPIVSLSGNADGASPVTLTLGQRVGSVTLYPAGGQPLPEDTIGLAEAFVSQAVLAIERARLDAEARAARLESEASELRAALFSAVTHDLKTPLSSVKAAVTSLLDADARLTHEDTRALLETILAEADRLGRLLGNVLDLARIEARALEPRTERADVAELVGAALQRMQPALEGRAVDVSIRDDLPEVGVDVVQIDQVLANLIENAVRFSPPDAPIRISAGRWQSFVEVRVADRGPGIPEGERDRIFDSFYRRDRGQSRGGSGLGLAIARAIVVAHKGRIRIEETPGGGTTVVVTLPLADADGRT